MARQLQYRDYTQFVLNMLNIETILNFLMNLVRKRLTENLSLENINTNSNGLESCFQICINTLIICHFLIKNYVAHTKEERN